jgi:polyhydroxyalkanoate synthesis regulator protein
MSDAKGETVVIKKYANRRLYNTKSSSYITLDHLAKMTREGVDFQGTGCQDRDRHHPPDPHPDHHGRRNCARRTDAARQLPAPADLDVRQFDAGLVPHYLEASMDQFRANQSKLREAFEASLTGNPLAKLAQQNLAIFKAAASAFVPSLADDKGAAAGKGQEAEIAALRKQMAEMQAKLDKLGKS